MDRQLAIGFALLGLLVASVEAHAYTIYKCDDDNGRPLYTSDKRDTRGKRCEVVPRSVNVLPGGRSTSARASDRPRTESPAGFPKEDAAARSDAKGRQVQILEHELAQEQVLLDKARRQLAEQQAVPAGEAANYANVSARVKPYRDTVEVHEKNVEALQRELKNLKR